MNFRPLTLANAAEAFELDQRCFPPAIAYSAVEIRGYLRLPGFHLGCREADNGPLLGLILTVQNRGRGHVITVDIDPGARRRGIGERLMRVSEQYYHARKARGMRLEAAVNNSGALAFYARLGYRITATLPHYYAADLDGVRLELDF
ncbi:MAG: GNAT family N-acetyltransferase [Terriglobales bacterium]